MNSDDLLHSNFDDSKQPGSDYIISHNCVKNAHFMPNFGAVGFFSRWNDLQILSSIGAM